MALVGLFAIEDVFAAAVAAGALATDAIKGSDGPFDARIQEIRRQPGQIAVAALYRELMAGSAVRDSHIDCARVQDPYSIRCQPQVMGACLDQMAHAAGVLEREARAVTDNPLLFPDDGDVLSGGNFHAEPVALAADGLALAVAEVGSLSERRVALLIDTSLSGLPPYLVEGSGLNSGFMAAQISAAALASENKSRAHPASVDSLPTAANQEDHVSMSAFAARRLAQMSDNARGIVAIELMAAAQGLEFHRPLESSDALEEVVAEVRRRVPRIIEDRYMAPDIPAVKELIEAGTFRRFAGAVLPSA
jgi:histidine ammonia-lyase